MLAASGQVDRVNLIMSSVVPIVAQVELGAGLREANIEIPYPQRDLHLRSGDTTLKVQVVPEGAGG